MKKIIFITLFFCVPSLGFTLVSSQIKSGWDTKTLTFNVNVSSCTALGISAAAINSAVDAAVEVWNSAPSSGIKLARGTDTSSVTDSNPPTIYCSSAIPSGGIAGQGDVASYDAAGAPNSGSLKINGNASMNAYFNNLDTTYQNIVVTHEIGHVLGLGHSEKQYALMYYDVTGKKNLTLSQDDVDGLTWLNPRSEPGSGVMGCGTIETKNNSGGGPMNPSLLLSWLALMGFAYVVTRPRRVGFECNV